jgi:hypothetical protein
MHGPTCVFGANLTAFLLQDRAGAGAAGAQRQRKARAHVGPRGPHAVAVPERLRPIGPVRPPRPRPRPRPHPRGTPRTALPRARHTDHGSDETGVLVGTSAPAGAGAGATLTSTTRSSGWGSISRRSCRRSRCPSRSGCSPGLARGACIVARLGNLEMSTACGGFIARAPLAQPARPRANPRCSSWTSARRRCWASRWSPPSASPTGPCGRRRTGARCARPAFARGGEASTRRRSSRAVRADRRRPPPRCSASPGSPGACLLPTAARLGAQVHGGHRGVLLPPLEAAPAAHGLPAIRSVHAEGGEGAGARRGWAGSRPWRPRRPRRAWRSRVDTACMMWPVMTDDVLFIFELPYNAFRSATKCILFSMLHYCLEEEIVSSQAPFAVCITSTLDINHTA